jgi:UDP-GlcNAc:undecaprenyl-phosphate/decaprenyl-phosphate GlcNAc-1-phosphate transferase
MILKTAVLVLTGDFFSFTIPLWILTILGFFVAFSVTHFAIPIIVKGSVYNGLYAKPDGRTSHNDPTPALGGIAIFAGYILATNIVAGEYFNFELNYLTTGLIVIFIVGVKDDVMGGKAWKKLIGQILAVAIISILADVRISNLYNLFGIGDIPFLLSITITVFVLLVIINGFNLIDGIDGLASGVGILIASILGIWFYVTNNIACTVMCSALAGALIAFFWFNVFNKKNKIFLGDTGSLTIGLVMGVLMVRFLQLVTSSKGIASINSAPAYTISLFIIPLFDSLRVFIIRIAQGKSPFHADRQHIHHRLLELGFTHLQATIMLLSINLAFISICYLFQNLGNTLLIVIQLTLATILSYMLLIQVKKKSRKAIDSVV